MARRRSEQIAFGGFEGGKSHRREFEKKVGKFKKFLWSFGVLLRVFDVLKFDRKRERENKKVRLKNECKTVATVSVMQS